MSRPSRPSWSAVVFDFVERCGERGGHTRWRFDPLDGSGALLVWYTRTELGLRPGDRVQLIGTVDGEQLHPSTGEREVLLSRCKIEKTEPEA